MLNCNYAIAYHNGNDTEEYDIVCTIPGESEPIVFHNVQPGQYRVDMSLIIYVGADSIEDSKTVTVTFGR